jgi:hypothetical protein
MYFETEFGITMTSNLGSYLAHSSTLKMEATYFSETYIDFRDSTRHYIAEDNTLQSDMYLNIEFAACEIHVMLLVFRCNRTVMTLFEITCPRNF